MKGTLSNKLHISKETYISLFLTLLLSGLIILLWHFGKTSEDNRIKSLTAVAIDQMKNRLESWIDARYSVIRHMGSEWYFEYANNPEKYYADAEKFIDLFPGFLAINWIDANYAIRRIAPKHGNEPALNKNLLHHPEKGVKEAILKSAQTGMLTRTPTINLLQGGKGFGSYFPIFDRSKKLAGFINGVFLIDTLVDRCFKEKSLRKQFHFLIFDDDGKLIYKHPNYIKELDAKFSQTAILKTLDKNWKLIVAPSPRILSTGYYRRNFFTLMLGLLLSVSMGLILRSSLRSRRDIRKSEKRFQAFMSHLPAGVFILNPENVFTFTNYYMNETFNARQWETLPPEEAKKLPFAAIFQNSEEETGAEIVQKEETVQFSDGSIKNFYLIKFPIQLEEDYCITGGIVWDITERVNFQNQLKKTIAEKDILLKEVHHRVKNNLQVIMSLIYLQAKRIREKETAEKFHLTRNRIRSMALIHEKLYKSGDFSRISFSDIIKNIVSELIVGYKLQGKVVPHFELEPIEVSLDSAIPLGLLINEIISISLTQTFKEPEKGNIFVTTKFDKAKNQVSLKIRDDGTGYYAAKSEEGQEALGTALIKTLVDQLQGEMKIKSGQGTEFIINFPLE